MSRAVSSALQRRAAATRAPQPSHTCAHTHLELAAVGVQVLPEDVLGVVALGHVQLRGRVEQRRRVRVVRARQTGSVGARGRKKEGAGTARLREGTLPQYLLQATQGQGAPRVTAPLQCPGPPASARLQPSARPPSCAPPLPLIALAARGCAPWAHAATPLAVGCAQRQRVLVNFEPPKKCPQKLNPPVRP